MAATPSEEVVGASHAPSSLSTPSPSSPTSSDHALIQNMKLQIITDEMIMEWEDSGKDQL